MKQVGLYFAMYRTDNHNRMPSYSESTTVGAYNTRQYDSSLSISLLYPNYADTHELFMCPAVDNQLRIEIIDQAATGGGLDDNVDTVDYHFVVPPGSNELNDPDYLIDPLTPANSRTSRAVYGDGPDLHAYASGYDLNYDYARNYANHEYGSNILFYDSHAQFLRFVDEEGRLENPAIIAPDTDVAVDEDIYRDDNYDGGGFGGDLSDDANLGNTVYLNDDGSGTQNAWTEGVAGGNYWLGPGWDRN
jgi:hypothetical protein